MPISLYYLVLGFCPLSRVFYRHVQTVSICSLLANSGEYGLGFRFHYSRRTCIGLKTRVSCGTKALPGRARWTTRFSQRTIFPVTVTVFPETEKNFDKSIRPTRVFTVGRVQCSLFKPHLAVVAFRLSIDIFHRRPRNRE